MLPLARLDPASLVRLYSGDLQERLRTLDADLLLEAVDVVEGHMSEVLAVESSNAASSQQQQTEQEQQLLPQEPPAPPPQQQQQQQQPLDPSTVDVFMRTCLLRSVTTLLSRTDIAPAQKARLNQFLQRVLDVTIAHFVRTAGISHSALDILFQVFTSPWGGFFAQSHPGSQNQMEEMLRHHFYQDALADQQQPQPQQQSTSPQQPQQTALPTAPAMSTGTASAAGVNASAGFSIPFFGSRSTTTSTTTTATANAAATISSPSQAAEQPTRTTPDGRTMRFAGPFARLPKDDQDTSVYFIININYFGTHGGFDALLNKLKESISASSQSSSGTAASDDDPMVADVRTLKLFVAPFSKCMAYFTPQFYNAYVAEFHELIIAHLLKLPEKEMRKELGKGIVDITMYLERFLGKVMSDDEASSKITLFKLTLAMKSFTSTSLEKRLNGLGMINKQLTEVATTQSKPKKEERGMLRGFVRSSREPIQTFDIKYFVNWLKQNKFVQLLTDGNTHAELIKQGQDLLILIAENDKFGAEEIDYLWSATQIQHAAPAVFKCILELLPVLSPEAIVYLIENKVDTIRDRDYDQHVLRFLFALASSTARMNNLSSVPSTSSLQVSPSSSSNPPTPTGAILLPGAPVVDMGPFDLGRAAVGDGGRPSSPLPASATSILPSLPLLVAGPGASGANAMVSQLRKGRFATSALWKLIQSPTRVPLELKQLASNLLLELLHTAEFQSDRTLVCGRCIENIARFSSVAQSLDLLTRIINTFPEKKAWKKDSKRSIIELLDNQYQLIAKTFAYVEERTRRIRAKKDLPITNSTDEPIVEQGALFMFLEYVMQNSSLSINRHQAELLWENVINDVTSEADRDDCFAWLKQQIDRTFVASDGPLTVLDEDAWSVLFTQKLCHTNIQNISPAAFVLFESLFIHINERERRIQLVRSHASDASDDADDQVVLQHPTNRHFEVISYADLTGLSYLWDITLKIVNTEVAVLSCRFLSSLVHQLSPGMKKKNRQKTRELFVHSCIERIAASMAEDPSFTDMESVASRIAERSLVLLRIFVDNLYQPVYQIPTIKPKPKKQDVDLKRKTSTSSSIVTKLNILGTSSKPTDIKEKSITVSVIILRRKLANIPVMFSFAPTDTLATLKAAVTAKVESLKSAATVGGRSDAVDLDSSSSTTHSFSLDLMDVRIFSMGSEFTEDYESLSNLRLNEAQKVYAYVSTDDEDVDFADTFSIDVLDDSSSASSSTTSKLSKKSRPYTHMKNRSVDAGWLEAMQQQLQAIGLSKMSPLLVSNNAVASPNIASSGSGGSNNGTVNSQGSIMNSNNSGSGKDDGLSLSSANSVSGGSTSSGGAGGSINLSGGGASSSSSKETGTSMDVFMMSDEDRVKSSMMLASQEHFDRLFQLLSAPDGIAVKAWQLLRVLPLNPAAVAKFRGETAQWASSFDTHHRYQLQYKLHVLQSLARENPVIGEEQQQSDDVAVSLASSSGTKLNESSPSGTSGTPAKSDDQLSVTPTSLSSSNADTFVTGSTATPVPLSSSPTVPVSTTSTRTPTGTLSRPLSWRKRFASTGGVRALLRSVVDLSKQLDGTDGPSGNGYSSLVTCLSSSFEVLGQCILDYGPGNATVVTQGAISAGLHSVLPLILNVVKLPHTAQLIDSATRIPLIIAGTFSDGSLAPLAEPQQQHQHQSSSHAEEPRLDVSGFLEMIMVIVRRVGTASSSNNPAFVEDDFNLVRHALRLFLGCCGSFAKRMNWEKNGYIACLLDLVLQANETIVRDEAVLVIESLAKHLASSNETTTMLLLVRLALARLNEVNAPALASFQYFKLCLRLLSLVRTQAALSLAPESAVGYPPIVAEFLPQAVLFVKNYKSKETYTNVAEGFEDLTLVGALQFLTAMLTLSDTTAKQTASTADSDSLVQFVYLRCLQGHVLPDRHAEPLCKSDASRHAAMQLLIELVRECPSNFSDLLTRLDELQDSVDVPHGWDIDVTRDQRTLRGHVGLVNVGNTCYMNSLLQQLFGIAKLRDGILSLEQHRPLDDEKDLLPEQSFFYQLQTLFANLMLSHRRYFDTLSFCHSLKDSTGQRINIYQQMDVQEFCNTLIDKIEFCLKGTPQEKLVDQVFGGKFVNEIVSKECPHRSSRDEPFVMISIDVKNTTKMEDGLKMFVKAELLDGHNKYHCGVCNQLVTASRRVSIKTLPNTLAIHLKRFEFDYEQMRNFKLNDRCEFPLEVDMYPFTHQALEEEADLAHGELPDSIGAPAAAASASRLNPNECSYELVGVLVHQGTADSGHYYSFVKDGSARAHLKKSTSAAAGSPPANAPAQTSNDWYEFNDSRVLPFDIGTVDDECFGGYAEFPSAGATNSTIGRGSLALTTASSSGGAADKRATANVNPNMLRPKTHNAYILFYEKLHQPTATKSVATALRTNSPLLRPKLRATRTPSFDLITTMLDNSHSLSLERAAQGLLSTSQSQSQSANALVHLVKRAAILEGIMDNNETMLLTKQLFGPEYSTFLWNVIHTNWKSKSLVGTDDSTKSIYGFVVRYVTRYVVEVVSHVNDKMLHARLSDWLRFLRVCYRNQLDECLWFLGEAANVAREIFVACPQPVVRRKLIKLFRDVLKTVVDTRSQLIRQHPLLDESAPPATSADKVSPGLKVEIADDADSIPALEINDAAETPLTPKLAPVVAVDDVAYHAGARPPTLSDFVAVGESSAPDGSLDGSDIETLGVHANDEDDDGTAMDGASTPGTLNTDDELMRLAVIVPSAAPQASLAPTCNLTSDACISAHESFEVLNESLDQFYGHFVALIPELVASSGNGGGTVRSPFVPVAPPAAATTSAPVVTVWMKSYVEYFLLLREMVLLGVSERKRLIAKKVVSRLVDFFNEERPIRQRLSNASTREDLTQMSPTISRHGNNLTLSSSGSNQQRATSAPAGTKDVSFQPAFEALGLLIFSCDTVGRQDPAGVSPLSIGDGLVQLPFEEERTLFDKTFLLGIIRDGLYLSDMLPILEYWSWGNRAFSKFLVNLAADNIYIGRPEVVDHFFKILSIVLMVKDSLSAWREDFSLSTMLGVVSDRTADRSLVEAFIRWVCTYAGKRQGVLQWMINNKPKLQELMKEAGWERRKVDQAFVAPADFLKQYPNVRMATPSPTAAPTTSS